MHKLSTDYSSTSLIEAAGIRHNGRYPVNCVRIACIYENITVLGSRRVLMKVFYYIFFYTMHSIFGVLAKEAKSLSHVKYLMHTHILVL